MFQLIISKNFHGARRIATKIRWTIAFGQPATAVNDNPHDMPAPEIQRKKNYFSAPHFYCVENKYVLHVGTVIAWAKILPSQKSPTKYSAFSRNQYIQLRRHQGQIIVVLTKALSCASPTAVAQWNAGMAVLEKKHYSVPLLISYPLLPIHHTTDELCRKMCCTSCSHKMVSAPTSCCL